jgi:hypothetical protein
LLLNRYELDIRMFGNMKKDEFKLCSAFVIIALPFILACANTPYIVGKWKEIGKTATLEIWKDGTFKAIDNQGITVNCLDFILSTI